MENITLMDDEPVEKAEFMRLAHWKWHHVESYYVIIGFVLLSGLARLLFHRLPLLSDRIPESCLLILLGSLFGGVLFAIDECNLRSEDCQDEERQIFPEFTPNLFFYLLLPPIILEAAFALHNKVFINNIRTVLLYAVIGTVVNFLLIGGGLILVQELKSQPVQSSNITAALSKTPTQIQILLFASLISAVDPVAVLAVFGEVGVNPDLYYLVFGESLLNDGVAIVIYDMMLVFVGMESGGHPVTIGQVLLGVASFFTVAGGGLIVGLMFGLLTALLTRLTEGVRELEPLSIFSLAYLAYLTADLFKWSGILSLIGCGLVQAHYAFKNISPGSLDTVRNAVKILSSTSDSIIFLYLGMAMYSRLVFDVWFICWTLLICFVARFIGTFLLTLLVNCLRQDIKPISFQEQVIMAYGGLRGAVGFSLVAGISSSLVPAAPMFVTTTLVVILFTVFIQGGTIKYLVNLLNIEKAAAEEDLSIGEEVHEKLIEQVMAGMEVISGERGQRYAEGLFNYYDEMYLKRWLCVPNYHRRLDRIFKEVTMADHLINLYGPAVIVAKGQGGDTDSGTRGVNMAYEKESESLGSSVVEVLPSYSPLLHSLSFLADLPMGVQPGQGESEEVVGRAGRRLSGVFAQATRKSSRDMTAKFMAGGEEEVVEEMVRRKREAARRMREKILSDIIMPESEERDQPVGQMGGGNSLAVERAVMRLHKDIHRSGQARRRSVAPIRHSPLLAERRKFSMQPVSESQEQ